MKYKGRAEIYGGEVCLGKGLRLDKLQTIRTQSAVVLVLEKCLCPK